MPKRRVFRPIAGVSTAITAVHQNDDVAKYRSGVVLRHERRWWSLRRQAQISAAAREVGLRERAYKKARQAKKHADAWPVFKETHKSERRTGATSRVWRLAQGGNRGPRARLRLKRLQGADYDEAGAPASMEIGRLRRESSRSLAGDRELEGCSTEPSHLTQRARQRTPATIGLRRITSSSFRRPIFLGEAVLARWWTFVNIGDFVAFRPFLCCGFPKPKHGRSGLSVVIRTDTIESRAAKGVADDHHRPGLVA